MPLKIRGSFCSRVPAFSSRRSCLQGIFRSKRHALQGPLIGHRQSWSHPIQILLQLVAAPNMEADCRRVQVVQVAHVLVHLCLQWRLQAPHLPRQTKHLIPSALSCFAVELLLLLSGSTRHGHAPPLHATARTVTQALHLCHSLPYRLPLERCCSATLLPQSSVCCLTCRLTTACSRRASPQF